MAAKIEEVVVDTRPLYAQQVGPYIGHCLLDRRTRRHIPRPRRRSGILPQHRAIHFAVSRKRHRSQLYKGRRKQELGEMFSEKSAQLSRSWSVCAIRRVIGHESLLWPIVLRNHGDLANGGMPPEHCLDLARLDSNAANLDLMVFSARQTYIPGGRVIREVAGVVDAGSRLHAERIGNESFRGQVRAIHVTPGQTNTADLNLTFDAGRRKIKP